MYTKTTRLLDKIIEICFYALFALIPLLLTPWNYELFEYNKMMGVYVLTTIIFSCWVLKSLFLKKIIIKRSPLDLFFLFFLASQFISTFFSMDIHTSIWGYYSRFHQGILASVSYFLLYLAFRANFENKNLLKLIKIMLLTGVLVAVYAILERFGIDKNLWVQDVQNRVFSTLGQPNWLAAYMAVLLPISMGMSLSNIANKQELRIKNQESPASPSAAGRAGIKSFLVLTSSLLLPLLFYLTLLFTKSRSGMIGFWIANAAFWFFQIILWKLNTLSLTHKKLLEQFFMTLNISFILLSFVIGGAGLGPLEKYSLPRLTNSATKIENSLPSSTTSLETGVTESGDIRKIVWRGATEAFLKHPLVGTGVETFAYAYYQYRPAKHNLTSEWDFLYNKAHNEYLNFAATTGTLGLGTYLVFIGAFIFWFFKQFLVKKQEVRSKKQDNKKNILNSHFLILDSNLILATGLFTGWLSILITNFFGFSVVLIGLFFFLLPQLCFSLYQPEEKKEVVTRFDEKTGQQPIVSKLAMILVVILTLYLLQTLVKFWVADVYFAQGYRHNRSNRFFEAYTSLSEAVKLNPYEPFYADEIAYSSAILAVALAKEGNATEAAVLRDQSLAFIDMVQTISPDNVTYTKSRVKTYYALSELDSNFKQSAVSSLIKAEKLAPTDAKIPYNLGIILARAGQIDLAIEKLQRAIELKPNYRDAYYALALVQKDNQQPEKARQTLQFILEKINKDDAEVKEKLKEWKNSEL